jgi:serpin B
MNIIINKTRLLRLPICLLMSFGIELAAQAQTAQTNSLAGGNTAFALDLYARLSGAPGNLFFSPYSMSTCLGMTYAGARGETETQMGQVLRFSPGQAGVHSAFGELQQQLTDTNNLKGNQLNIANALWTQQGEPFLPSFLKTTTDAYQASVKQADFTIGAGAVVREINDWVAQKTQDRIKDILSPANLDSSTRLVLANAIYFKGRWASLFMTAATRSLPFSVSRTNRASVPLMTQRESVRYMGNDDFQAVELPYIGDQLSMLILLPRQVEGLGQLEKQLTPAFLARTLPQMENQRVTVFLPRFKLEWRNVLNDTLAEMGMTDAFVPGKADFSGINGTKTFNISVVIHKAWLEVNEEGTEAAAGSVGAMGLSGPPRPTPVFRADHPFIFLIRDTRSGSLLFIGRMADPKKA